MDHKRFLLIATTALAPMIWGTSYFVSTELLPADRPLLAGLVRALPSGIALLLATRMRPTGSWWFKAAALGTLNIGAFFALMFIAAYRLPGGVAATLGSIQPLVAAGLGALLLSEPLRRHLLAAGAVGIVGVGLLVLRADAKLDALGVAAGLAGAISMATGVVLTKRWGRPVPLLAFTSWQLIAGGLVLLPLTLFIEGTPPVPTATNMVGFVWLTTIGTIVAYNLWFRGVQSIPVAQVSLLGVLSPLVASLVGLVALDQTFSLGQAVGATLILTALFIGQREPDIGQREPAASRSRRDEAAVASASGPRRPAPASRQTPSKLPCDPRSRRYDDGGLLRDPASSPVLR